VSYDRKIDHTCPHFVRDEMLFVESDRRTFKPFRPISAINSVSLRVDGIASVPSTGLLNAATLTGNRPEPFNITSGSDKLVLSVDGGPDQTLTAVTGKGLSAIQIVRSLQHQVSGIEVVQVGRKVGIRSRTKGQQARVQTRGGGLGPVLGILNNRVFRGQQAIPGWSLVYDPNTELSRPTRLIVFDRELPGYASYIEVDYSTIREECRRCGGLGVENDWRYGGTGEVTQVTNEVLLLQEFQKFCFTLLGSNPFNSWYGTEILNAVGKKLSDAALLQNFILTDIYEGFRRWQSIKKQQEETVGQEVSDEEFPLRLVNVTMQLSQQDPTVVFVNVVIQSRSLKEVQFERGIRLPQPLDVMGSTAQEGVFRESINRARLVG